VRELLVGLRERGLNVTRPILVVIDGAKALRAGVLDVFDHPVIARCQLRRLTINGPPPKIYDVRDILPERAGVVSGRLRRNPAVCTVWRRCRSSLDCQDHGD
jgi:putative transposase